MKYIVEVRPLDKPRNWEVTKEVNIHGYIIPEGFRFDGASIPLGLRWMFPHGGRKFAPACLHDYLYRTGVLSKNYSDLCFYEAMLENGVNKYKAKAMYLGVKYGGHLSWRKRRRENG